MLVSNELIISTGEIKYISAELAIKYNIALDWLEIFAYIYVTMLWIEKIIVKVFSERSPPLYILN